MCPVRYFADFVVAEKVQFPVSTCELKNETNCTTITAVHVFQPTYLHNRKEYFSGDLAIRFALSLNGFSSSFDTGITLYCEVERFSEGILSIGLNAFSDGIKLDWDSRIKVTP